MADTKPQPSPFLLPALVMDLLKIVDECDAEGVDFEEVLEWAQWAREKPSITPTAQRRQSA